MNRLRFFLPLIVLSLVSCEQLALLATPHKKPELSNSTISKKAKQKFWQTLHAGKYHDINDADKLLMAAYLKSSNDYELASYIGFLHIWKLTERQRNPTETPLITNEVILSSKYFADALELQPQNPIYRGFYGDTQLVEGTIFHDKRTEVKGYFTIKQAISEWPEFNYFATGYLMTVLPTQDQHFQEVLEWQWKTLDRCTNSKFNRENPNYGPYLKQKPNDVRKQQACYNTWVAPHNLEGFFMNLGDLLVKSGDWKTAIKIYKNAKLPESYAYWPYKDMLLKRIKNAKENVVYFQKDQPTVSADRSIMFNSGYGCVACHQAR